MFNLRHQLLLMPKIQCVGNITNYLYIWKKDINKRVIYPFYNEALCNSIAKISSITKNIMYLLSLWHLSVVWIVTAVVSVQATVVTSVLYSLCILLFSVLQTLFRHATWYCIQLPVSSFYTCLIDWLIDTVSHAEISHVDQIEQLDWHKQPTR